MYLLIEKTQKGLYAYREDDKTFRIMQKTYRKGLKKLAPAVLDNECDLSDMPHNAYIVFKLAETRATKKPKAKKPKAKQPKKKKKASRAP